MDALHADIKELEANPDYLRKKGKEDTENNRRTQVLKPEEKYAAVA